MSCWVVPALAAEIWGIPLQQILDAVCAGTLPTKDAIGLTFVDVAPTGPKVNTGYRPPAARPETFTPARELTRAEHDALSSHDEGEQPAREEELLSPVDEHEEGTLDWRAARRSASRLRRAPRRLAA